MTVAPQFLRLQSPLALLTPKFNDPQPPSTQIIIATTELRSRVSLLAALQSEPGLNVVGEVSDQAGLLAGCGGCF